jgi:hypothetical protein
MSLNGYWVKKDDENETVYVEKVFKKGYVTGFKYLSTPAGTIHSQFKITHDELLEQYNRK